MAIMYTYSVEWRGKMGGYLIPESIKAYKNSWSRKSLASVGLMQRKHERINVLEELIDDITEKEIGFDIDSLELEE